MNATSPAMNEQSVGDSLWFGGGLLTFKVTSAQSGGSMLIIEHEASAGKTTPLHIHPDHDETLYIFEGEIRFLIGGEEITAGPGSAVCAPRGVPHAFIVTSPIARSLGVCTPGAVMEAFFRSAGDVATSLTLPPPEINIPRLLAAGESTGAMKVLGPPPFAPARS